MDTLGGKRLFKKWQLLSIIILELGITRNYVIFLSRNGGGVSLAEPHIKESEEKFCDILWERNQKIINTEDILKCVFIYLFFLMFALITLSNIKQRKK